MLRGLERSLELAAASQDTTALEMALQRARELSSTVRLSLDAMK
jgi:uncharacterized membrane protein